MSDSHPSGHNVWNIVLATQPRLPLLSMIDCKNCRVKGLSPSAVKFMKGCRHCVFIWLCSDLSHYLLMLASLSLCQLWYKLLLLGVTQIILMSARSVTLVLPTHTTQSQLSSGLCWPMRVQDAGHVRRALQRWIWFWQTLIWFVWQIWVINILHCTNLTSANQHFIFGFPQPESETFCIG